MEYLVIYDIILCAVLIISFFIGYKRGFLRNVWGISSLLIALALTAFLRPHTDTFFRNSILNSIISENVYTAVYDKVNISDINTAESTEDIAEAIQTAFPLPDKYALDIAQSLDSAAESTASAIAQSVSDTVTLIAGTIFLFIVIRIILALLYSVLKIVFSFPVLRQTNKLAGAIVQLAITVAVVYLIFAAAAVYGTDIFEKTYLCKLLYNNNILLSVMGM